MLNFSKRIQTGLLNQASGSTLNLGEYWYFVIKIVLFSVREKLGKFEARGQEVAQFLRSLEQFIQKVKGRNNFW